MGRAAEAIEFAAARGVVAAACAAPERRALNFGVRLARLSYRRGWKRSTVMRQIATAFPSESEDWVEGTARATYDHFGREAAAMARLTRFEAGDIVADVMVDAATEQQIEAMRSGGGSIFVTGHFGNWELLGTYLAARGVRLASVAKRQSNRRFDRWLTDWRASLGMGPIYAADAPRRIPRLLRDGRTVALVADQHAHDRGLDVTFMGQSTSIFRGPARLTMATGVPMRFGVAYRDAGRYRVSVVPVLPDPASDVDYSSEREVTRAWVRRLEDMITQRPEQYFWFHRRWRDGNAGAGARYSSRPHENGGID